MIHHTTHRLGKATFFAILVVAILAFAAGFTIRALLSPTESSVTTPAPSNEVWTCSMHPQIRLPQPGMCPLCSMPLVKATGGDSVGGTEPSLELSEHARTMAAVETTVVQRRALAREIAAVGKVEYNEAAMANITVRVEGYVERLFVDYTGIEVKEGDHLVEIYSPSLIAAQQELLVAMGGTAASSLVELSTRKLRYLGLTQNQIDELIQSRKIQERLTLYSPIAGTVIEKMVLLNSAVKPGDTLYRLANLESVWVSLEIYESELPWVRYGQTVIARSEAYPGVTFTGRVWFISPILNEATRTIKVMLNFDNHDKKLKPGMFVSASIRAELMADGKPAPTGVEGKWTCPMHPLVLSPQAGACPECQMPLVQIPGAVDGETNAEPEKPSWTCPMHPEVVRDGPGTCPICKMDLERIPTKPGGRMALAVPLTAVLDTGLRKLVYVEKGKGYYIPVAVEVGPRTEDAYPVLSGLKEGDKVVTHGAFLLDSQFQIRGLPSLISTEGISAPIHDHSQHAAPTRE